MAWLSTLLTPPMSSPLTHGGRGAAKTAFTLIELLTVIAIIGILAAITFGVVKGVQERGAISQARTELAALSTALEAYKRQYGDYPQTGGRTTAAADTTTTITTTAAQAAFFNSIGGKLGPKLDPLTNGKQFVEFAKFTLETANMPNPTNDIAVANAFIDPWGRRYVYRYKDKDNPGNWKAPSYVLFSVGPDGATKSVTGDPTNAGVIDYDHTSNADNLYANRP